MENNIPSVELDKTFTHIIRNYNFDNLPESIICDIFKDGRPFSKFIELWLEKNYPLTHIKKDKNHDFVDRNNPEILYDEKTFTIASGCRFCPSNMIGQGRSFDKEEFEKKTRKLIFCIVSNINFPEIKIRFVRGSELIIQYPDGKIPLQDHIKFFN